jgi:hypothetical protein
MRTKTLAIAAAFLAAGLASSVAQSNVYSLNVVGYVNVDLPAGFTMIANPLKNGDNTINTVLADVPPGTLLYKFDGSFGSPAEAGGLGVGWDVNLSLAPGEGAFIQLPTAKTVTFVGEVTQGNTTNSMPAGFSIRSSVVPQSAGLTSVLGFPAEAGDIVYFFNKATQSYAGGLYESGGGNLWDPSEPSPAVGEAFWVQKAAPANWVRDFNVPQAP